MTPPNTPASSRRWLVIGLVAVLVGAVGVLAWKLTTDGQAKSDPLGATEANARGVGHMEQFVYVQATKEFRP